MNAINQIWIDAPADTIYSIASATSTWPNILPHYRFVRTTAGNAQRRTLVMGARRDWIPVGWIAEQTNFPEIPEIRFTHVGGWTRGMEVVWRFLSENGGTRVVIEHKLEFRFPFFARWIGKHIVGEFFVENIASKTLARIKSCAERAV